MREGCPSMTAPLGLLALASYQKRDKMADPGGVQAPPPSQGIDPGRILGGVADARAGGVLKGGLGEMPPRVHASGPRRGR